MLSNLDITNLMQPFVDRELDVEEYVIELIAKRVKEIGSMTSFDLPKMSADIKSIERVISKTNDIQVAGVKKLMHELVAGIYAVVVPLYVYRFGKQTPLEKNDPLQNIIKSHTKSTSTTFRSLFNDRTQGFIIRDLKYPGKKRFYNVTETYRTVIDEAKRYAKDKTVDYKTAMRKTLKQLNESGLQTMDPESGYHQNTEAATKKYLLDGIHQASQEAHIEVGKQFGADGYELTAHPAPAPDHAPFQGHMFRKEEYEKLQSNKDFTDLDGNHFEGVQRVICQWNCRHFAYPIIVGVSLPKYSKKELDEWLKDNEKGVRLPNGKHMTLYEAYQEQNRLARKVRKAKQGVMMAQEAGDMDLAREYQTKVNRYTEEYRAWNDYAQIEPNKYKLAVPGYHKIKAA